MFGKAEKGNAKVRLFHFALWGASECDFHFSATPATNSRRDTRLPCIFKDLAVPRSLVSC
jgi:hypothetical protein